MSASAAYPTGDEPLASVIVCTYNRADLLGEALRSIVSDTSVAARELLVIDNGSTDATAAVVKPFADEAGAAVRYVREPRAGKSNALNRGLREARGRFLLFTDDDVIVDPGWSAALLHPLRSGQAGVASGRTLPSWPHDPPRWLAGEQAESLGLRDRGELPKDLAPIDVVGVNMAIDRRLLAGMEAPFDPALGPSRRLKFDYEEFDLLTRLGTVTSIAYVPTAVVRHRIDDERMELGWMRRTYFQRGFGALRHRVAEGMRPGSVPGWLTLFAASFVRANRTRLRNARQPDLGPEDAMQELYAYFLAGQHLQGALLKRPQLAEWAASHLA